ncbi:amidase domain-containing protein [Shouchella clausii]|uniref:amidase domain-containing protein n=1 Tax=Shouchella clausii TaxID=79880 RepID=UPI000BA63B02|nr:amidase domain-containing protein [Shouchella clausii]PAD92217.1 hypothetical protein CHH52_10820 [Shouchella clausii]
MKKKLVKAIHDRVEKMNQAYVRGNASIFDEDEKKAIEQERKEMEKRGAEVVRSQATGDIISVRTHEQVTQVDYAILLERLIVQDEGSYMEERVFKRRATFTEGRLRADVRLLQGPVQDALNEGAGARDEQSQKHREYNRRDAVRYAERWWNDYNPAFKRFEDNCTNFISQCLYAGGAPMTAKGNTHHGWWYENSQSMSLSWSVAHSFRWYLSGAQKGLRGEEKQRASQLLPGDVICYDFDGSGRWDHTAIVVAKDLRNEPLVNAQTANSRMRYWTYQNSPAYTPDIQYKFFRIVVD